MRTDVCVLWFLFFTAHAIALNMWGTHINSKPFFFQDLPEMGGFCIKIEAE